MAKFYRAGLQPAYNTFGMDAMNNDDANQAAASGGTQMLFGFWYPAMAASELKSRAMKRTLLLGVPLAVGRDARGRAFAMRDGCPHRGIPLSFGKVEGAELECPYHGWRFDVHSGQCKLIPSWVPGDKLKVDRIYANAFPCEEADGFIWAFMTERDERVEQAPPVPQLPVFSDRYRLTHLSAGLPVSIDHGIIGLMDPAHGPFVHQAWWWRTRRSIQQKEKVFEAIENGFRIRTHSPSPNSAAYKLLGVYGKPITTTIEFVLPNLRLEQIHCGDYWFSSRAIVTPLTEQQCRLDFSAAWNVFRTNPLVTPIFRFFGRRFIAQDTSTMEKQALGLRHNPRLMLIDDADRPAKWYFQLKQAYLESRRSGQPMRHPIQEPVTLHWRS